MKINKWIELKLQYYISQYCHILFQNWILEVLKSVEKTKFHHTYYSKRIIFAITQNKFHNWTLFI